MGKCAEYFKGNEVSPIPELVAVVGPGTLSFVVVNIRTERHPGLKKETFGQLLGTVGIPDGCFCKGGFATWNMMLPSEEIPKSSPEVISQVNFSVLNQNTEAKGKKVIVHNVSTQLIGDALAAYLSMYGGVEDVT